MCVCMLLFYPGSTNPFTHTNTIEIGDDTSMSSSRFLIYDKTTIRKRFNFNLSIQHTFWFYSVLIIFHLDPQTHHLCLCSLFNVILKCKMLESNIAVRMVGLSLTLPMHACVSSNRNMIKIRKISPHWWIFHSTALYIRPILWLDIHGCYWMLFANASLMNFTSNDESVSFLVEIEVTAPVNFWRWQNKRDRQPSSRFEAALEKAYELGTNQKRNVKLNDQLRKKWAETHTIFCGITLE